MLMSVRGAIAATLLAGTALAASPALAQDAEVPSDITVSANVSLTSDYRFRGVSLSDGDIAIQGGFDVSHESGFYVGTWASSLDESGGYGSTELDLYGGWSGDLGGATVDVGLLYYAYPNAPGAAGDYNYWEPYAKVSSTFGPATVTGGIAYAWKQDSLGGDDNLYLYGDVEVGVPNTPITISGHLGYTDGVLAPPLLAGSTDDTGLDWSIGASATVVGPLSVSLAYVGVEGPSIDSYTNDAVVATLSASF
ncbi:TorF family putative porin [Novosphingobium mangrovi (ex Huang et al. 2023)]|uniref:TorF family putative porin n=1 Tax=Novosphingobium mangrovi (ex Huang et al. 2023) TaxID=2976432 RepID=A0ABT2I4I3_9SPHN|nr:TorF family putative porin [Novosphingobium mangrovi (ex Huang et al. 2023)]MCT2399716.1 TorF family putative porin [Novosphingobium mangrovi (ex Huang et al. 2023)]